MKKINFSDNNWKSVKENYRKWWSNELDRPLIFATTPICATQEPEISERICQGTFANTAISPQQFAKRAVYEELHKNYYADAYPLINMDFSGPGILAAYLGADLTCNDGRIWFHPQKDMPSIEKLTFKLNKDNYWFKRTIEVIKYIKEYSEGNIVIGCPDLGGVMDVLSTFFPSESLFYEMADSEEEVLRLLGEIENAWYEVYDCLFEECSGLKGYSSWSATYSDKKTYIHQCDFAYMIGGHHFDKFVLPTLKREFSFIEDSIYHLDGKGQIIHLDKLLKCSNLQCVQWVPGDGNGVPSEYPELINQVLSANKTSHVWANKKQLLDIKNNNGLKGSFVRYSVEEGEDIESSLKEFFAK